MNKDVQVVLFFKKDTFYNANQIAALINNEIEDLGEAMVLPQNAQKKDEPIILFQNPKFQLTLNYETMTLMYYQENSKEGKKILLDLLELFDKEDLSFIRIGYITTYELEHKWIKKFKEKFFAMEEVQSSEDFQLAWYSPILLKGTKINLWQKYLTDSMQTNKLIVIYDVNTPVDEEYNISTEFVHDYLNGTEDLLEKKISELKNE